MDPNTEDVRGATNQIFFLNLSNNSISTGCWSLDVALGVGGVPKGRIIESYGPESSGKTTLALQVVSEAQKSGGICF